VIQRKTLNILSLPSLITKERARSGLSCLSYYLSTLLLFQSITINTEHSTSNEKEWLCVERITIIKIQNMMINKTVSYYNNADDSRSKIRYNLDYVLGMIRDDQELFQQTVRLRFMPTEEEYKQAKKLLPMIAPSGVFDYRNDDPENLKEYSNVLVLDFDHFQSHLDAEDFKKNLIDNADRLHIYALWFSPSGSGVKVGMLHDNTNPMYHNELFRCIREQLYAGVVQFDDKCGNLSRTFF